jgi:hypothetical protein
MPAFPAHPMVPVQLVAEAPRAWIIAIMPAQQRLQELPARLAKPVLQGNVYVRRRGYALSGKLAGRIHVEMRMAVTGPTPVQPVKFANPASACRIAFHARFGMGAHACPAPLAGLINAERTAAGMPAGGTTVPVLQATLVIRANARRPVPHAKHGMGLPARPQPLAATANAERTAAGMPAGGTMVFVRRVKLVHQASACRIALHARPGMEARVRPLLLAGLISAERTAAGMPAERLAHRGRHAIRGSVLIVLIVARPLAGHLTAAAAHARQGLVPAADSVRQESA